jgi:hypothetical protein
LPQPRGLEFRSRGAEIADLKAFLARLEKRLSENKATEAELKRMLAEKCKLRTEENVELMSGLALSLSPPRRTGRYRKGMISSRPLYQGQEIGLDPETFAQGRRHVPRGSPSRRSG